MYMMVIGIVCTYVPCTSMEDTSHIGLLLAAHTYTVNV